MSNIIKTRILSNQPFIAELDSRLGQNILRQLSQIEITNASGIGYIHNAEPNDFRTSKTLHTADTSEYVFLTEHLIKIVNKEFGHLYNISNSERIQFTKYEAGDYFKPHRDFHNQDRNNPVVTQDRVATIILYINDDYTGGDTYFPDLDIRVKPQKGKILFFTYAPDELLDINLTTMHEGEIVKTGHKIIATQWFLEEA